MKNKKIIILSSIFAIATIILRLLPHPWNFTPIGALFVFFGFFVPRKLIWIPLVALSITDIIIGSYQWQVMMSVYGSYAIMFFLASLYKKRGSLGMLEANIISAVLFFIITNFAHWLWFGGYSHDIFGLLNAYIAGIPFFRNALFGQIFYGAVFYSIYELVLSFAKISKHQKNSNIQYRCHPEA
jgi:hypothetical protein